MKRSFRSLVEITRPVATFCTATVGLDQFCNAPVPPDAPVSMCGLHLTKAFRYCESLLDRALGRRTSRSDVFTHPHLAKERRDSIRLHRVVYYALIGPHVKIGTTGDVAKRMRELKGAHLLAVEPGSYDIEKHRHAQFAHLHLPVYGKRSEMFEPGEDLLEHIDRLVQDEVTAACQLVAS
jgi:hypothetical protein